LFRLSADDKKGSPSTGRAGSIFNHSTAAIRQRERFPPETWESSFRKRGEHMRPAQDWLCLSAHLGERCGAAVTASSTTPTGRTATPRYTGSKLMEAVEFLNASDTMPSEVIGSFDRALRLVFEVLSNHEAAETRRKYQAQFGCRVRSSWLRGGFRSPLSLPVQFNTTFALPPGCP
jgi:hypothetical protein